MATKTYRGRRDAVYAANHPRKGRIELRFDADGTYQTDDPDEQFVAERRLGLKPTKAPTKKGDTDASV